MFRLNVLQNQWLTLALIGGAIIVLIFALAFIALWRPRPAADAPPPKGQPLPWILIASYVFVIAYVIVYTIWKIYAPPNW